MEPEQTEHTDLNRFSKLRREWIDPALIAIACALIIRTFILQPFEIPSGSMEDTLLIGDHLMVSKYEYCIRLPFIKKPIFTLREPKPGEVVVFIYPIDNSTPFIKRCIAVAGQKVEIRDKMVYVDGVRQNIPECAKYVDSHIYPSGAAIPRDNVSTFIVPDDSFFAMGDNRDNSNDSRFWGVVPYDHIIGRALFKYWSTNPDAPILYNIRWNRIFRPIH